MYAQQAGRDGPGVVEMSNPFALDQLVHNIIIWRMTFTGNGRDCAFSEPPNASCNYDRVEA